MQRVPTPQQEKGSEFPVRAVDPVVKSAHGKNGRPVRLAGGGCCCCCQFQVGQAGNWLPCPNAQTSVGGRCQSNPWMDPIWRPPEAWRTIPACPALHGRHRLTDGRLDGWHGGAPDGRRALCPPICLCFPLPDTHLRATLSHHDTGGPHLCCSAAHQKMTQDDPPDHLMRTRLGQNPPSLVLPEARSRARSRHDRQVLAG